MYDFVTLDKEWNAKEQRYIYRPAFIAKSTIRDLMTRGRDFYAIYDPETGLWETNYNKALEMIDHQIREAAEKDAGPDAMADPAHKPKILRLVDTKNGLIDKFAKFVTKDLKDNYHELNQKMIFSNTEVKKEDYATRRLEYPLIEEPTPYYDKLCDTLYLPDERQKWEWLVGSVIAGEQQKIQKMLVFYGEPGTGKSTIIDKVLVDCVFGGKDGGYSSEFEANNLVGKDSFGTDFLENSALFVYDNDAELGIINSKTTLNKIISHESVVVNVKFKSKFTVRPRCILVIGSNEPVQLAPNSGMNRRLIDIRPTGNLIPPEVYDDILDHLPYERSGIAWRCYSVYKKLGKNYYKNYVAEDMLTATSPFQNFVVENYYELKDGISLANAYQLYCSYAEACNFKTTMVRYKFRDTLKLYYDSYKDQHFDGFRHSKIGIKVEEEKGCEEESIDTNVSWLCFDRDVSILDDILRDCPAQYTNSSGNPITNWDNVDTHLCNIDTHKLHFVRVPLNHIVIDFDIKDENGKSLTKNMEAANKFPPTYAELSKSGSGIHLHYIYAGDPNDLAAVFGPNIEIKVFNGKSALRRKLTKCNGLDVAPIASGLPFKEQKMVSNSDFEGEQKLRNTIIKTIKREIALIPSTKCGVDFIETLLKNAYASGGRYDVRDLQQYVTAFAAESHNHGPECVARSAKFQYVCKAILDEEKELLKKEEDFPEDAPIIIFDVEIYPSSEQVGITKGTRANLPARFIVCWKFLGNDNVQKMLNPSPEELKKIFMDRKYRPIGFNNLPYDNHMIWARMQGYTEEELYRLSCKLIDKHLSRDAKFGQAKHLSYTDILDYCSAANKMSLKKWEYKLQKKFAKDHPGEPNPHIHKEWNIPWNLPITDKEAIEATDYCCNDVRETEGVFLATQDDFEARLMLAQMSGLTPNDSTNAHTTEILTHGYKDPTQEYVYTDLSTIFPGYEYNEYGIDPSRYDGEKIVRGKSIYMGKDPGEGGYAICPKPGMYTNVALLDVASMHPHSAIKLNIFGDEITKRYENLVEGRVAVKHIREIGDDAYQDAVHRIGSVVVDALKGSSGDELKKKCKSIANALKTAINAVYGLTSAKFQNRLRDPRNVDNIIAKYGALFMITLRKKVEEMGYTVVHIKTDSIKIANADKRIVDFVNKMGKEYGYTFEHEATYDKICIVNDAVYIAKYMDPNECEKIYGYAPEENKDHYEEGTPWTATGTQFQVPYVYKKLFSGEEIEFEDLCETKTVQAGTLNIMYTDGDESFIKPVGGNEELFESDNSGDPNVSFVGRVGLFCPVLPPHGGDLVRINEGKAYAVTGTKGFKWVEADTARLHQDWVDETYYKNLCDKAIETINQYGSYESFISDDFGINYIPDGVDEEVPFE